MKLFTTASALHYLGRDFQVKTEIYIDEKNNLYDQFEEAKEDEE